MLIAPSFPRRYLERMVYRCFVSPCSIVVLTGYSALDAGSVAQVTNPNGRKIEPFWARMNLLWGRCWRR